MGHPRTDPQFDRLALERLLNQRMIGALQLGDRMSGDEIFLERKAALGDRIVRRRDADINLDALMNPDLNIGVPGGTELLAVAAAIIGNDAIALDAAFHSIQ